MIRIEIYIWLITGGILISIPIGILLFYVGKFLLKKIRLLYEKIEDIKALEETRKSLFESLNKQLESEKNVDRTPESDTPKPEVIIVETLEKNTNTSTETPPIQEEKLSPKVQKNIEKLKYEALLQKERGNLENYEKKLIEGLALDPDNIELTRMLADYYFTIGNHKKSLTLLKKILEQFPQDHKVIRQIGEIYLAKGDFETAQLLIEKAISLSDTNPKYYISLVEVKYNTEQKIEAIQLMERVVKLRPTNINYLHALATLYEEQDDIQNAKKYYYKILEIDLSNDIAKEKINTL